MTRREVCGRSARRAGAAGACALAAALLAGCGGSPPKPLTKAAYDRQLVAIGHSYASDFNALDSVSTVGIAERALIHFKTELQALQKRLAAMTPPAPIKAQHARLVAAMGEFAGEIDPVITAVASQGVPGINRVGTLKGFRAVQAAVASIRDAGYKVG